MFTRALLTTEYRFVPGIGVSDWFELHASTVEKTLNGKADIYNKQGGLIRAVIPGKHSTVRKAEILSQIEESTGLVYVDSREVQLMPSYGERLKEKYGDKVVIE